MLLNTSARTYDLRTRARTGAAAQSSRVPVESPDTDSPSNEAPPQYDRTVTHAEAANTVRLYSDAVASRPPSPRRERPVVPLGIPAREPNHTLVLNQDQQQEGPSNYRIDESEVPIDDFNSSMEVGTPNRADSHWTTSALKMHS